MICFKVSMGKNRIKKVLLFKSLSVLDFFCFWFISEDWSFQGNDSKNAVDLHSSCSYFLDILVWMQQILLAVYCFCSALCPTQESSSVLQMIVTQHSSADQFYITDKKLCRWKSRTRLKRQKQTLILYPQLFVSSLISWHLNSPESEFADYLKGTNCTWKIMVRKC